MDSINEWLNLDQADEEIGGLLSNDFDSQRFAFEPLHFTLDQTQQQQQQLINNNQPILSLDPSTILSYPPSSSASLSDDSEHSAATKTTPSHFALPFERPADHFPTYALDPALLSASIPPHHPSNNNNIIINSSSSSSASATPQINPLSTKHPELKITLPRRSPSSFKTEDDQRSPILRVAHSRSSSAITFGQQPTPASPAPSAHKRTLSHSHPLVNVPEWEDKPSAEEYKMLSSKEKRQLRNKISARNFRHRRKQHISALEQQVAQRDQTIEALYNDLGAAQNENKELKSQVEQLKQKWSDLMKKIEEMSLGSISPTTLPNNNNNNNNSTGSNASAGQSTSALPASPRLRSAKTNAMIPLPNLHKDLGSHTRKPFNGVGGMTGGGNVGVHTTLIPDVSVDVYKGLLGSGRTLFNNHDDDEQEEPGKSPQALLEQKLEHATPAKRAVLGPGWKLFPSVPAELALEEKAGGGRRGPVDEGRESGSEDGLLAGRLWWMVCAALAPDPPSLDSPLHRQPSDMLIDPRKLAACLDGRLVLKLVEPAPPPYPSSPSPPAIDSQADPLVDLVVPRLAGCRI
ncbi:hypothetical protein PtB15_8B558 [Puccinia triticina]|nr:hypothetical protein PtB15_8B558 [Puccinia triticina]